VEKILIVKVLVFNHKSELLLLRRSATAPRRPLEWDFPGGFVDEPEESFRHAAVRELEEEAELQPANGSMHLTFAESELRESDGVAKGVSWLYFETTVQNEDVRLSYEHDKAIWVTLEKAKQMIRYEPQLRALTYIQERNAKAHS
jgi:8-oxo-dGTP pyrophosphatase MutT (NUDIX family)